MGVLVSFTATRVCDQVVPVSIGNQPITVDLPRSRTIAFRSCHFDWYVAESGFWISQLEECRSESCRWERCSEGPLST